MNLKSKRAQRRHEAGQALAMLTLGIVMLFGLADLAVEVGHGHYVKQVAQTAATGSDTAGYRDTRGKPARNAHSIIAVIDSSLQ
jgi:hypothetical protein